MCVCVCICVLINYHKNDYTRLLKLLETLILLVSGLQLIIFYNIQSSNMKLKYN